MKIILRKYLTEKLLQYIYKLNYVARFMERKRGSIELSFNMIFSIIVIIALIGVAFYAISSFLDISKCAKIGIFYNDFQDRIDKAWRGSLTKDSFTGNLPNSIENVCFGNLSVGVGRQFREQYEELSVYAGYEANTFLYPGTKACDSTSLHRSIKHINAGEFFCVPVENGEVSIKISKESGDALVRVLS